MLQTEIFAVTGHLCNNCGAAITDIFYVKREYRKNIRKNIHGVLMTLKLVENKEKMNLGYQINT